MHPSRPSATKVLVALYENGTSFESVIVDFSNSDSRAAFFEKSPMGKMPVLQDMDNQRNAGKAASSSSIIHIIRVIAASCRKTRKNSSRCGSGIGFRPLHPPAMQRIVGERLRPEGFSRPAWRVRGACDHRQGLRRSRAAPCRPPMGCEHDVFDGGLRGRPALF